MNHNIFKFLKKYNTNETAINRLLVSAFIADNNKLTIQNRFIKSYLINKDSDEYIGVEKFIAKFKKYENNSSLSFEVLLELFEFVISPSDKLINGAIYTPKDIRNFITLQSFKRLNKKELENILIADISCGCGGFLIDAVCYLKNKTKKNLFDIYENNIYGIDIQEYSIVRTKILLCLLAIMENEDKEEFNFNLYSKDSLEFNIKDENLLVKQNDGFDLILGNPPYVCSRNMDDKTKQLISTWSSCSTGHPDLYIPFFEIGYKLLSENGVLGYITVNSFIKSLNGRAIRKYFEDNSVDLTIIDFEDEQIFTSRMTYTSICFLHKNGSNKIYYTSLRRSALKEKISFNKFKYKDLDSYNGWHFKNKNFTKKIESNGTPLGNLYNTKSGIATLKNNVYIFKPIRYDETYYYIDDEIRIEKDICRDIVNSNLLIKTNDIVNLIEKIIFPYVYDQDNNVKILEENEFKSKYPKAYEYLLCKQNELFQRDKGKGKFYTYWYAFGRNQSLERTKYKLLFPQLARKGFHSYLSDDENLYFYNGMAALSNDLNSLLVLQKIFMSDIFRTYVSSTSKNYASNYYSMGRNYIKNFGIIDFNDDDMFFLNNEQKKVDIDHFFTLKYNDLHS